MKKSILFSLALGALMASCAANDEPYTAPSDDGTVTFQVNLPTGMHSRAISDGLSADNLHYAVYDASATADANGNKAVLMSGDLNFGGALSTTVSLNLVKGQTYDIVFWASAEGSPYTYTDATQTVKADYTGLSINDEKLDAFFTVEKGLKVDGAIQKTVTLYRPFAQINVGTDDIAEAQESKIWFKTSDITVKGVHNSLNLFTGVAGDELVDITFAAAEKNDASEVFPANTQEKTYDWLSMNYVLTGTEIQNDDVNKAESELVEVEININGSKGTEDASPEVINTISISNVPVQRNYRTNIYGSLITTNANFTVEKENNYNNPDYSSEVWDGVTTKAVTPQGTTYNITEPAEFAWVVKTLNDNPSTFDNKTVKLTSDLDFANNSIAPIASQAAMDNSISDDGDGSYYKYDASKPAFKGVLDGNGKTIRNLNISGGKAKTDLVGFVNVLSGANAAVKNLTFENVNIQGNEACGVGLIGLVADGATVDNVTVKSGSVKGKNFVAGVVARVDANGNIKACKNYADVTASGNFAGGIVAYPYGTEPNTKTKIKISDCENHGNISGGYNVGGVAGICSADVSGCDNYGAVSTNGNCVGGVIGEQRNGGVVENCTNHGTVTADGGDTGIGGVIGWVRPLRNDDEDAVQQYVEVVTVKGCTNQGNVNAPNYTAVGGVVGQWYRGGEISNCSNTAESIIGGTAVAGVCGNFFYRSAQEASYWAVTNESKASEVLTFTANTNSTPQSGIVAKKPNGETAPLITYGTSLADHISITDCAPNTWTAQ